MNTPDNTVDNKQFPAATKRTLSWLLLFAGTAAVVNRTLITSALQSKALLLVGLATLVMVLVAIALMIRSKRDESVKDLNWGVPLDRDGLLTWTVLAILTVVLAFVYPPVLPSMHNMIVILLVASAIFVTDIVLRAFLISHLVSVWGTSRKYVFLSILASALLLTGAQNQLLNAAEGQPFMRMLVANVLFGYFCYYGRSILPYLYFVVVGGVNQVLPSVTNGEMTFIFATELVLYLAFGLLARRLTSQASNELEPALSRNG